jgi:hypothetical protein
MELDSLLKLKLERELWTEIESLIKDDAMRNIVKDKIKEKIEYHTITIDKPSESRKSVPKVGQCIARSMGGENRRTDIQCRCWANSGSEYCNIHLNRLDEYGYLNFGRYDKPRPIINEKGNKIPWRDSSAMGDINTLIQYQNMNLSKLIKQKTKNIQIL